MNVNVFFDTNILAYAYDLDAGGKREKAKLLLSSLWHESKKPWISVQVLQELFVILRKRGVEWAVAQKVTEAYTQWRVIESDVGLFRQGVAEARRWQLSFWDGLILAAARQSGCRSLYSEDFNSGQDYGGVVAVNPLL